LIQKLSTKFAGEFVFIKSYLPYNRCTCL